MRAHLTAKTLSIITLIASVIIMTITIIAVLIIAETTGGMRDSLASMEKRIDSLESSLASTSAAAVDREADSLLAVLDEMEVKLHEIAIASISQMFRFHALRDDVNARRLTTPITPTKEGDDD